MGTELFCGLSEEEACKAVGSHWAGQGEGRRADVCSNGQFTLTVGESVVYDGEWPTRDRNACAPLEDDLPEDQARDYADFINYHVIHYRRRGGLVGNGFLAITADAPTRVRALLLTLGLGKPD